MFLPLLGLWGVASSDRILRPLSFGSTDDTVTLAPCTEPLPLTAHSIRYWPFAIAATASRDAGAGGKGVHGIGKDDSSRRQHARRTARSVEPENKVRRRTTVERTPVGCTSAAASRAQAGAAQGAKARRAKAAPSGKRGAGRAADWAALALAVKEIRQNLLGKLPRQPLAHRPPYMAF